MPVLRARGLRLDPHDAGPLPTPGFGADAGAAALRYAPGCPNLLTLDRLERLDGSAAGGATVDVAITTRAGDVVAGLEAAVFAAVSGILGTYTCPLPGDLALDAARTYRLAVHAVVGDDAVRITRPLVVRPYAGGGGDLAGGGAVVVVGEGAGGWRWRRRPAGTPAPPRAS